MGDDDHGGRAADGVMERDEALLLGLLSVGLLVYWGLQFEPFFLPNNDFPSFERTARSLAAFELPTSFQRMPIYPALMALVAPFLPEPHPYLHAALLLNIGFSLGTLWLLFLLASRAFGRGALLVPLLFATGPGSEIQRPLAIVVIGGLISATALTLILLPILYERFGFERAKR